MMKKFLFTGMLLAMISTVATAQSVSLVFGSLDGDEAGYIYAYDYTIVDVDVWIKTEPGIRIVGLHLPLSSNDIYIVGRIDGVFDYPLNRWYSSYFTGSQTDPSNEGYTVQSITAERNNPNDLLFLQTDGEWNKIATFKMTAGSTGAYDAYYCHALIEGEHPDYGGISIIDANIGELEPWMYSVDYSCLNFDVNPCGFYVPGDFNGSGSFNVADIIAAYSYLRHGSPLPSLICECPPESGIEWPVVMDLNNSCTFDMADLNIIYLKDQNFIEPCEHCPPR